MIIFLNFVILFINCTTFLPYIFNNLQYKHLNIIINKMTAFAMTMDVSMAPVLACLKGLNALPPVDPTGEFKRYIPYLRTVNRLQVSTTDYSDKKNVTIPYFQSKTLITDAFIIADNFSPQHASKPSDKMCYCDYPALNQFKTIDVKVGNSQIESITPQIALKRLREIFCDNWAHIANNFLGGSSETNNRNQVYEGYSLKGPFNNADLKQNIIKPSYRWYLPIPASLFTNRDKFKYNLAINSMLEFQVNFASIKTWISYSPDFIPQELSGTLDVFVIGANPNEYAIYFNNLPHVLPNPTENYFINDIYDEFSDKKQPLNQEQKVLLRQGPTKELRIYYTNGDFVSGYRFYGNSIKEAAQNFIASHIQHTATSISDNTINLSTGLFTSNGTNINGLWSVDGWTTTGRSFVLKYRKNNSVIYGITVTSSTAWGNIGTLYLDLNTYANDNRLSKPQLLYFETFNLDIMPYDRNNISFSNLEDRETQSQQAFLLVNGFYTYQPDNAGLNTMAFWNVSNIKPSLHVEDALYNFSLSQPVTTSPNSAHYCVQKKQLFINRPYYNYDDLDKIGKIQTEQFSIEKITGHSEIYSKDIMLLAGDLYRAKWANDPDEHILFSWKNYPERIDSDGYMNVQTEQFNSVTIKWLGVPLIFDGQEISDTLKERTIQSKQSVITVVQQVIRTLRYNADTRELEMLSPRERDALNKEIWEKVLVTEELTVVPYDTSDISSMKKIRTGNPHNSIDEPVLSRSVYVHDRNSMNNTLLRPALPISRGHPGMSQRNRMQDASFAPTMF